jgi:hypothetical protein
MQLEHYYVNVIDLPEILPFTLKPDEATSIDEAVEQQDESGRELFEFVEALETFDTIHYIGQDNIEGKFYQRFLFEGGGFIEIMQRAPCAIIAHFPSRERAEKFVDILRETVRDVATDKTAADLLVDDITISEEKEGSLSYEQWTKMKNVRDTVEG